MRTVQADEAFRNWRKLAGDIGRAPVKFVGEAEGAMVVMTEAEYQKLKGQAWDLLTASMDQLAGEAAATGLTEAKLDEL